jgi:hypothetical protein
LQRDRGVSAGAGQNALLSQQLGWNFGDPLTDAQIQSAPNQNWLDVFFRQSTTMNHNISLTSGGENLNQFRTRLTAAVQPYWSGEIRWRKKTRAKDSRWPGYVEQLSGARAVIGERTMACVEACLLGIPAYTTDASMTTLLMGGIENLGNTQYPDRTAWWEHICWSQFNRAEFNTTVPADLVEQYQIAGH